MKSSNVTAKDKVKRLLLLTAGTAMIAGTFGAPTATASENHGKLFQEVGGTWYVCMCVSSNANCQPCQS